MKQFLKIPGGADLYQRVTLVWEWHHNPEMVVTESETGETVTYDLSKYDFIGLHRLMHRLGFSLLDGKAAPPEAVAVTPLSAPFETPPAHALAHTSLESAPHETPSGNAASLPQKAVDTPVPPLPAPRNSTPAADQGLRSSVLAAIEGGDELLAQGLVSDRWLGSLGGLRLGGALCLAALVAVLCLCGGKHGAAEQVGLADAALPSHAYQHIGDLPLQEMRSVEIDKNV